MECLRKIKETAAETGVRFQSAYIAALAALTVAFGDAGLVFAESTLSEKIEKGLNDIYADIWAIIVPLYALVILIGCARIFFTNGRKAEGIVDWIKRAAIAFAVILCTMWIIQLIQKLTEGGQYHFN